jgi:hypothetical protein
VHSPLNGNPAAAIAVRPKQDINLRIIKMSDGFEEEGFGVHLFTGGGKEQVIYIRNIDKPDADYFRKNNIKISMEQLNDGEFVTYACPYSDDSEESELIEFANGRTCQEIMSELAKESRLAFGDK